MEPRAAAREEYAVELLEVVQEGGELDALSALAKHADEEEVSSVSAPDGLKVGGEASSADEDGRRGASEAVELPPNSSSGMKRLVSLDQYRGFTMFMMLLVNYMGDSRKDAAPFLLLHGESWCSVPDLVMPAFHFCVGFAFRITLRRNIARVGRARAYSKVLAPRAVGLLTLSFLVYGVSVHPGSWDEYGEQGWWYWTERVLGGSFWQTLTQIALAMLWVMPVMDRAASIRVLFMICSSLLNMTVLASVWMASGIVVAGGEGGMFGFMAWQACMILGSLAHDLSREDLTVGEQLRGWRARLGAVLVRAKLMDEHTRQVRPMGRAVAMVVVGLACVVTGYALSCLGPLLNFGLCIDRHYAPDMTPEDLEEHGVACSFPHMLQSLPFTAPRNPVTLWNMQEGTAAPSLMYFAGGISLMAFSLFFVLFDVLRWRTFFMFTSFGMNSLATYLIHFFAKRSVFPLVPRDSPAWFVWCVGLPLFMGVVFLVAKHLQNKNIVLTV